jgi:arylsulfatase A-like enzyme
MGLMVSHCQTGCESRSRPNIIFLLTDDQRWDAMSCMDNPNVDIPNMDALARGGTHFINGFVTSSICTPSRASIMTGLYERAHQCNFNTGNLHPDHWQQSYPVIMRKHGYHTGFIGKFGFAVSAIAEEKNRYNRSWHDIANLPGRDFDMWYGFAGQGNYFPNGRDGRHLTRIMADQALDFIQTAPADRPFCLSVSFKAPHGPHKAPDPDIFKKYRDRIIPRPETARWEYFESLPPFLRSSNAHAHGLGVLETLV